MTSRVPLSTLLSWVWVAHTFEVDNAFEAARSERLRPLFPVSLPMWTNGLRLIGDEGVTVEQLRSGTRAACNLGGLERWGWISVGEGGITERVGRGTNRGVKQDTMLRPTRAGSYARRLWPKVVEDVEARWHGRFGADLVDGLAGSLQDALAAVARPMPWSPPEVNPSDGFGTHVVDGVEDDGPVPLVGLLGQMLTAVTLDHERRAVASLPLGANFLRVIDGDVPAIGGLPARTGLSKEAVAMGTGYLQRSGLAEIGVERTIGLTPAGRIAAEDHLTRTAGPSDGALHAALEAIVAEPGRLAEGLIPPAGGWRTTRPYLAQTQRLLADPVGALPWHPMVLHRGGWPDGS